MTPTPSKCLRIAFVGGDCRISSEPGVRCFASRRDGGRRGLRDLLRCIKQRTVDEVVMLVRWLGHSDFSAVKAACRAHGVRYRVISGGASMAQRESGHD